VSASPWHLYPFLSEFFEAQGFPRGTFHLREFRLVPGELRKSFRPSRDVKLAHCRELLKRFPERQFVLVGDSGEWDAAIYGQLWREFSGQVKRILIRRVREEDLVRVRAAFAAVPRGVCEVFGDAVELASRSL
jgi:phosphatidate phosphatase APP1